MSRTRSTLLLLAFLLVPAAAIRAQIEPDLRARIDQAIERGVRFQLASLEAAGERVATGEKALVLLSLLHSGAATTEEGLLRGLTTIDRPSASLSTYERALRIMVVEALDARSRDDGRPFPFAAGLMRLAREDAQALAETQNPAGAWRYGAAAASDYDNSCTQYALLGLRSALNLGFQVSDRVWVKALRHLVSQGRRSGGAGYQGNDPPSPAMTSGVLSSLLIARVRASMSPDSALVRTSSAQIEGHLAWLEKNWKPLDGNWGFYAIYGLERAAALAGVERLGKRDWYREGALALLEVQMGDGSWTGQRQATAFALLFLCRSTRARAGETADPVGFLLGRLGRQSQETEVAAAVDRLAASGPAILPLLVPYLEAPEARVREAADRTLRKITGKGTGFDPARDAEANRAAIDAWRAIARKP